MAWLVSRHLLPKGGGRGLYQHHDYQFLPRGLIRQEGHTPAGGSSSVGERAYQPYQSPKRLQRYLGVRKNQFAVCGGWRQGLGPVLLPHCCWCARTTTSPTTSTAPKENNEDHHQVLRQRHLRPRRLLNTRAASFKHILCVVASAAGTSARPTELGTSRRARTNLWLRATEYN